MKKKIVFVLIFVLLMSSCNKNIVDVNVSCTKTNALDVQVDSTTVSNYYYENEFDLTSINLIVTKDGKTEHVALSDKYITNMPISFTEGTYNLKIKYETAELTLSITIIKQEEYTEGLIFTLSNTKDYYTVTGYTGNEVSVIIPSKYKNIDVKEIKQKAFYENEIIEEVIINQGITTIDASAFAKCDALKKVTFPSSLVTINKAAFYDDEQLNNVYIPSSVTIIGDQAFNSCKIFYLETSLANYQTRFYPTSSILYENINLEDLYQEEDYIYLKQDDTYILTSYRGTSSSIVIKDAINDIKITKIGAYAFASKEMIEEVNLTNNIIEIGSNAFNGCSIKNITLPLNLKEIGSYAFANNSILENVIFNDGLEKINRSAFANCRLLQEVILPTTVLFVDDYTFQNCYVIQKVYIPKSVTYIGEGCFYANSKATIYIEASVIPSTWSANWNISNVKYIVDYLNENSNN